MSAARRAGAILFGYWHCNAKLQLAEFSKAPLKEAARRSGWTEEPLYTAVPANAQSASPTRITVDAEPLQQILQALVGSPFAIRELQATQHLHTLGHPSPIQALLEQYNEWVKS